MQLQILVSLDGDAMRAAMDSELDEILHEVVTHVALLGERDGGKLQDSNGNTVGHWQVSGE